MPEIDVPDELTGLTADDFVSTLGNIDDWRHNCHNISLALVRSHLLDEIGPARVVRGTTPGVPGQHSWVAIGSEIPLGLGPAAVDVYSDTTWYLDLTLWSYSDDAPLIALDTGYSYASDPLADLFEDEDDPKPAPRYWGHQPFGAGSLFNHSLPHNHGGPVIEPTGLNELSASARSILKTVGSLDLQGWNELVHLPCGAGAIPELLEALATDPLIKPLIPIDHLGNATGVNPSNLYW